MILRKTNCLSWVVATLAITLCALASAQHPGYRPVVGEVHPDFELPNIEDGSRVKLSDYRGKKVLLLHFASW